MLTHAQLVTDLDWLQAIQLAADVAPDVVRRYVQHDLRPFVSNRIDQTLRSEPGPVVYPIEWASERQRRYVMGYVLKRDADGNIIPYERTHELVHGWHVRVDYEDGFSGISVYHDSWRNLEKPVELFVTGQMQQPFHINTGWAFAPEVFTQLIDEMDQRIEAGLPGVLDEIFSEVGL